MIGHQRIQEPERVRGSKGLRRPVGKTELQTILIIELHVISYIEWERRRFKNK